MARLRVLIFVMAATICVAIQMKGKRKFWVGVHVVLTGLSLWVGHSLNFFVPCKLMWPQSLLEKGDERAWPVRLVHNICT